MNPDPQPRYRANLQGEVDSAAVYTALAKSEKDPNLAEVFHKLAAVEQAHAAFWQRQIGKGKVPLPSLRAHVLSWMARRFGPARCIALPAGFRANGTGFGVTLIGPAWADEASPWHGSRCNAPCPRD